MSYDYAEERKGLFTERGVERLIRIRDKARHHIIVSGAFRLQEIGVAAWEDVACIDYMVEQGELVELKRDCWGQFRVFTSPRTGD
jgi:hypothetical protein